MGIDTSKYQEVLDDEALLAKKAIEFGKIDKELLRQEYQLYIEIVAAKLQVRDDYSKVRDLTNKLINIQRQYG